MRVACLGDSCTFGQNVRADQAWPWLLHDLTGYDVRNLGVNGDTTRLALERWHRDVDLVEPEVVVIQFGHNDANLWHGRPRVSAAAFNANLNELQKCARPARLIALAPHESTVEKDPGYNGRLESYRWFGMEPRLSVSVLPDGYGVHPDVEGHRVYAEHVAALL